MMGIFEKFFKHWTVRNKTIRNKRVYIFIRYEVLSKLVKKLKRELLSDPLLGRLPIFRQLCKRKDEMFIEGILNFIFYIFFKVVEDSYSFIKIKRIQISIKVVDNLTNQGIMADTRTSISRSYACFINIDINFLKSYFYYEYSKTDPYAVRQVIASFGGFRRDFYKLILHEFFHYIDRKKSQEIERVVNKVKFIVGEIEYPAEL